MKRILLLVFVALLLSSSVSAEVIHSYNAGTGTSLNNVGNAVNNSRCNIMPTLAKNFTVHNVTFYVGTVSSSPDTAIEFWTDDGGDKPDTRIGFYLYETTPSAGAYTFPDSSPSINLTAGTVYHVCAATPVNNGYWQMKGAIEGVNNHTYSQDGGSSFTLQDSSAYVIVEGEEWTAPAPAGSPTTYTVSVIDFFDDSDLSGVNVTFGAGCWNTTDGSGDATVNNNITACMGLSGTINANLSLTGYAFNATSYDIAPNETSKAGGYEGLVNVTGVTRLVDGATLSAALDVWTVNTTGGKTYNECGATYPCLIYLTNGSNPLTLQSTGYYDKSFSVSITAPETTTATINGVYDAVTTVYASNAYTGAGITNFTINASNATNAYTASYSTTTGSVEIPSIYGAGGIGLFLLADADGYALANTTFLPTNSTPYYNFSLWSNNSLRINIFDEDTGAPIYSNVTVIVTGNSTETTYYTTTADLFVQNLTDGNYTVKFQAANYTLKSYSVTVADRSSQELNAYLSASTNTVIFTCMDDLSVATIDGVSIGMYRIINSTLTLVESKSSDITGRAQFTYSTGVRYSFIFTKAGYDTRTFSLDPILFSSYDVYLTPEVTETYDYNDVGHYYTPSTFYNDENNSFVFAINSPAGILTAYNVTVTWPNGTWSSSGSNANGDSLSTTIEITGARFLDTVNVTYTFTTVFGNTRTYSLLNLITGGGSETIIQNKKDNYGLGLFERILFATLLTIVFGGLATLATNSSFGLFVGMVVLGVFSFLGFVPWLVTLLGVLVSVFIMAKKGGGY